MTCADRIEVPARAGANVAAGAVSVSEGYCINLRGRIEACDLCRRACHAGAISLGPDKVEIDPDRCTDCGACVPACPAGAISHARFDPEQLLATGVANGRCKVACAADPSRADATIPCHKMLDARLMAALFAEGAEVIVPVGTEHCGDCPSGDARPALAAAARTLAKWFGEAAPRVLVARDDAETESETGAGGRAVRRRALLRRAIRSLTPPTMAPPSFDELAASGDPDDVAPGRPVSYQAALAARRRALPFRPGAPVGATGRTIGEACSGCLICAELCPTGALEGDCSTSHRAVSFDPALCTNCTLCLKICPMEAIAARALRGVGAAGAGRTLLYARAQRHCPACGAPFAAADPRRGLCPTCENDQEMDEEWLEMLGI